MPTELHEELIDDVRFCVSELGILTNGRVAGYADAKIMNAVMGQWTTLLADAYLALDDCGECGEHLIAVEVGRMKDGKWSHIRYGCGSPMTVLRVGFDRSTWLLNPKNTPIETTVMEFISARVNGKDTSGILAPEGCDTPGKYHFDWSTRRHPPPGPA
ncbi:MAG: hypothetical protein KAX65_06330 [Caldilineaceae bacterium]|nr:hypothetical protein [Caldilineaceae bacterium]